MRIILASGSSRRKELLELIVPKFEIIVSNIYEELQEGLECKEQAIRLSYFKAKDVFNKTSGERIIIGSDTIVTKNKKIYGKPKDRNNAVEMLKELTEGDKINSILTGLVEKNGIIKEYKTFDEVKVFLKSMTENEINKWIDSGKAMDKAGAYGIQDEFCAFVDKIDGNYTTAVGLPIHKLYDILKEVNSL